MKESKFSMEEQEGNKELVDSFFEEFSRMSSEEQDRVLGLLKEKANNKGKNYKPELEELEQR